ncbi:hypothetical protein [Pantoea vagans]|nr:hypothetical protein [Pantoea vagans]
MSQKENFRHDGFQPKENTPQSSDSPIFEGYQPPKQVSKPAPPPKKP